MMSSNLDTSKLFIANRYSETLPAREHLLLLDKPAGRTSFSLVAALRRASRIQTIGHAGTLDPFATGVMILLVGRSYTKLSSSFLNQDKEYLATVRLGISTDTYDSEGAILKENQDIPSLEAIQEALSYFQGTILQTPPMFSAKKLDGKKLYELARKGIEVEREKVPVTVHTQLLSYEYPYLEIKVSCSKGTYVRSIAHDLGEILKTGAHLSALTRLRSGHFHLADCLSLEKALSLYSPHEGLCASSTV